MRKGGILSPRNDRGLALSYLSVLVIFVLVFVVLTYGNYAGDFPEEATYYVEEEKDRPDTTVWVREDLDVLSASGQTTEGQASLESFTLENERVMEVKVALSWSDDYGSNDRFRVTLQREGEVERVDESEAGSITLYLKDTGGGLGGNYSVIIEAVDCPGVVEGSPVDRDDGNSWELSVNAVIEVEQGQEAAV